MLGDGALYYTQVQYTERGCTGVNYATVQVPARPGDCEDQGMCIPCMLSLCSFRQSCEPLMSPTTEPNAVTEYTFSDSSCSGEPQKATASSLANTDQMIEVCGSDSVFTFRAVSAKSDTWTHPTISLKSCSAGVARHCNSQFDCSDSEEQRMAMYALAAYEEQTPGREVQFQSQQISGSFVLKLQTGWRTILARPEWFLSYDMCLRAPVLTVRGSGDITLGKRAAEFRDWMANAQVFSKYQHAGFLSRAQVVYSQLSSYFRSTYLPHLEVDSIPLYVIGHSLGAATASLLPFTMKEFAIVSQYSNYISEFRGYGFATPRVFSRSYIQNNQIVTYSNQPFLPERTSFKSYVYRDDIVPRIGITSAATAADKCESGTIPQMLWFLSIGGTPVDGRCSGLAQEYMRSSRLIPIYEIPGDIFRITDSGISSSSSESLSEIENSPTATYDHSMEHYARGVGVSVTVPAVETSKLLACPVKQTCGDPRFIGPLLKRSISNYDFKSSLSHYCLFSSALECVDIFGQRSNLTLLNAMNPRSYCLSRDTIVVATQTGVVAANLDDGIPVTIRNTSISHLLCDNYDRVLGINGTKIFNIIERYTYTGTLPEEPTSSVHIISSLDTVKLVYMVGSQLTVFDMKIGSFSSPAVVYSELFENVIQLSATSLENNATISLLRSDSIFTFRTPISYITTKDSVTTPVSDSANLALDPFGGLVVLSSGGAIQPIGNVFIPPVPPVPTSTLSPNSQSTSGAYTIISSFGLLLLSLL